MEDLIGVRVPDTGEETRVGQRALEGVALTCERLAEVNESGIKDFEATKIER